MTKTLHLGPGLDLPESFATEGVAAIGMRGSGKSNTLVRWAELLYGAHIPFCAIDPKGDWGGIRSSADGKHPGLSVPVFGGLTGNFPLEEKLGGRIADLLVDTGLSAVLDVSRLSIAARARFLTDFFHRLMDRHQTEPHVRCVILEEAHRYIPQQVSRETAAVKEAAAAVLLEGRAFGLGCWAATQRPARLHKDVLEEVGTAVVHRIGAAATNDLRTIAGWVKHEELSEEIVPSLTKLANGEAWVLAPSTLGIAQRVQVDRRHTFDSASTPLVGAGSRPVVTMADIDASAIKEALADAIEKAKADDPAELHKRIRDIERQLRERPTEAVIETVTETVEVPAVSDEMRAYLAETFAQVGTLADGLRASADLLAGRASSVLDALNTRPAERTPERTSPRTESATKSPSPQVRAPARRDTPPPTAGDIKLGKGERAVLTVLAQYPQGRTASQLCMLTGYTWSGGFRNFLSALRTAGLMEGGNGETMRVTEAGVQVLGDWEPLPTGRALLDYWLAKLGRGERAILAHLVEVWPEVWTGPGLAEATGYEWSGGFRNFLSKLRTLQLIEGSNTTGMTAAGDFIEAIR